MTSGLAGQVYPGSPGVPGLPGMTVSGVAGVPGIVVSGIPGPPGIVMSGVPGDPGITVSGVPGEPGLLGVSRQRVADWSCPGAGTRESGIDWAICFASNSSGAPSVISTSEPLSSSRSFAVVTWIVIAIRVSPGIGDAGIPVAPPGSTTV